MSLQYVPNVGCELKSNIYIEIQSVERNTLINEFYQIKRQ